MKIGQTQTALSTENDRLSVRPDMRGRRMRSARFPKDKGLNPIRPSIRLTRFERSAGDFQKEYLQRN